MLVPSARIWLLAIFLAGAHSASAGDSQSCFKFFDGTLYRNKPDLQQFGIRPIAVANATNWLPKPFSKTAIPEEHDIATWLEAWLRRRNPPRDLLVIDLEHWPVDGDRATVKRNVDAFVTLLDRVRRTGYYNKIGYYGLPPIRNYWQAIDAPTSERYKGWQGRNDALQPLANVVDAFFPSLYTFYEDQDGWVRYAIANLSEARRMAKGKPIYAFIWPQYHSASKTIGRKYIPEDFWSLQLQTIREQADGVVVWGGYRTEWDAEAPWWKATVRFLSTLSSSCRSPLAPTAISAH